MKRRNAIIDGALFFALVFSLLRSLPLHAQFTGTRPGEKQPPLEEASSFGWSNKDTLDLFLLAGQSNMKGRGVIHMNPVLDPDILFFHSEQKKWYVARDPLHAKGIPDRIDKSDNAGTGPGMSFARELRPASTEMKIGLIPAARGGASINLYKENGSQYKLSLELMQQARESAPVKSRVCAVLWLQGESDSMNEKQYLSYEEKLLSVIKNYRAAFANPDLPFLVCTIGSFIPDQKADRFPYTKQINEILLALPDKCPHTACVDARDLRDGHIGDYVHYSTEAQLEIGKRFARAYLEVQKGKQKGE